MTVSIRNIRFIESIPAKSVSWIINKGFGTNLIKPNCRLHIITLLCKVEAVVLHIINGLGLLVYCFYARRVRKGEGEPPPWVMRGSAIEESSLLFHINLTNWGCRDEYCGRNAGSVP